MIHSLGLEEARTAATAASGITSSVSGGSADTLAVLRRLGSVQIDTISVVERAHHHALWTRNPGYEAAHLDELQAGPRRILEYWSHAAAYLPIEHYRFCIPRMDRIRAQGHEWFSAEPGAISFVRERIRSEGPLRTQDFEGARGAKGWWDWKPAKRALEYLFHAGELVVAGRRGFQKIYDLPERALPEDLDRRAPSDSEMASRFLDQAVQSLGVFRAEEIAYLRKDGTGGIQAEIAARLEEGRLVELRLGEPSASARASSSPDASYYAAPRALQALLGAGPSGHAPRALVLSPFDPLIIDRKRTERLFGLGFQLECYLPARKRAFGYFALPLLYVDELGRASMVGLLDAKAERGRKALVARRLRLDPPIGGRGRVDFARAIATALSGFAVFNRAETLELERFESSDGRLERSLRAAIARLY